MRQLVLAASVAALAFAGPSAPAAADPVFADPALDDAIERAIPHSSEIEAMAPALDRLIGALLQVDVGPVVDAIEDPYSRERRHARRGVTLGEIARRDDPHFDARMRDSLYGTTAEMGRVMDTMAVLAPILRRNMAEMEREIERAVRERPVRRPPPPRGWGD